MPTAGQDTVAQCVEQAVAFLAQSDSEFDAGDRRQGSEKLYGAATQVVIAAASSAVGNIGGTAQPKTRSSSWNRNTRTH